MMSDPGTWIVETLQLYLVIFPIMASLLLVELQECFYSSAFNHRAAVSSVGGWGLGDGGTMHTDGGPSQDSVGEDRSCQDMEK